MTAIDRRIAAAVPAIVAAACLAPPGCTGVSTFAPAPPADGAPLEADRSPTTLIHRVRFPLANAYIVESRRTGGAIVVDTGPPGKADDLLRAIDELGIARDRVAAIVLTHAHRDHAGAAAEIRYALGAPILIHALDAPELANGWGGPVRPNTPPALLGWPFAARRYTPFEADRTIADELRLDTFGIDGVALHTPGHTDGSLSVVLDSGGAIMGDLLAGALFDPDLPDRAFFHGAHAPTGRIDGSLRTILGLGAARLFPGHGGPIGADDVRERFLEEGRR